jgi:hypothetical protein
LEISSTKIKILVTVHNARTTIFKLKFITGSYFQLALRTYLFSTTIFTLFKTKKKSGFKKKKNEKEMTTYDDYTEEEYKRAYERYREEEEEKLMAEKIYADLKIKQQGLSMGLSSKEYDYHRTGRSDDDMRRERSQKYLDFQTKLRTDNDREIPQTRKPFVRREREEEEYGGLMIGNQSDKGALRREN